ncbi:DUF1427 family protein [Stappia sp. 28M-7]|uniref:DUF1427 family protein n=1 Tax=Stappia sp. 28M-7 TaxID=2762596 RepID=UPI00163C7FB0|nr:DUF1427 family protein [Stappia sp. 28M-7]MBC2860035.1 DUF1427 family protein [Stappia sp. 28M-7]
MKMYLLSLGAGILVGIVYSLLNVRSPAPPIVALVGLLGILLGEQVVPMVRHALRGAPMTLGWIAEHRLPHICGELPSGTDPRQATATSAPPDRGGAAG